MEYGEKGGTKIHKDLHGRNKKQLKINFQFFFSLSLACLQLPPVLEKGTFPWWEWTPHSQAKCHLPFDDKKLVSISIWSSHISDGKIRQKNERGHQHCKNCDISNCWYHRTERFQTYIWTDTEQASYEIHGS